MNPIPSPASTISATTPAPTAWGWHSRWPAPAKLNLFLHVVGRRADGYHLLQTLFRFIDYGDSLSFQARDDAQVVRLNPLPGVPPEQDLALRAACLLQAETGCRQGVNISLEKRLPMGGGLGGGSSDAATVLLALNQLWGLGLSRTQLQALGLRLGADVPVFVFGQNAFAEGVGEQLQPVSLPEAWYLVLVPPVAVPTAAIFQSPALRRDTPAITLTAWQEFASAAGSRATARAFGTPAAGQAWGFGHNDLEPVACTLHAAVAEHLAWLQARTLPGQSRMSGSGACVFAEFSNELEARALASELPPGWCGWVASGLAAHPLATLPAL